MAIEITPRRLPGAHLEKPAPHREAESPFPAPGRSLARSRLLRMRPRLARRNFSSRASELSGGKAIILSIPKCGRTWIRTFLCAYFCKLHGRDFTLEPERYRDPSIPRFIFSHDLFAHRTKGRLWDRLRRSEEHT